MWSLKPNLISHMLISIELTFFPNRMFFKCSCIFGVYLRLVSNSQTIRTLIDIAQVKVTKVMIFTTVAPIQKSAWRINKRLKFIISQMRVTFWKKDVFMQNLLQKGQFGNGLSSHHPLLPWLLANSNIDPKMLKTTTNLDLILQMSE